MAITVHLLGRAELTDNCRCSFINWTQIKRRMISTLQIQIMNEGLVYEQGLVRTPVVTDQGFSVLSTSQIVYAIFQRPKNSSEFVSLISQLKAQRLI